MDVLVYRSVRKSFCISDKQIRHFVAHILTVLDKPGDISIQCVGLQRMKRLQEQYRNKSEGTDVLSFPVETAQWMGASASVREWGDVVVCIPYIYQQAKRFGVSFREEFFRMLAHGVLHLLGYTHDTKKHARVMFALQEEFVFGKKIDIDHVLNSERLFILAAH